MTDGIGRVTLARRAETEMTERKSVFLGTAAPVSSEEEARELIEEMRRTYHDATHHVYAYLLDGERVARYSDDGEPQGTAGVPVLTAAKQSGATDLCVVVTRYFGGILLGAGGLVRAYGASARQAIEAAGIVRMTDFTTFTIRCGYGDYQKLLAQLPKWGAQRDDTVFAADVALLGAVETERFETLCRALSEMSSGCLSAEVTGHREGPADCV